MAQTFEIDTSETMRKIKQFEDQAAEKTTDAIRHVSDQLLSISADKPYVPHDEGELQRSAKVEIKSELERIVGFNKKYAAYLHEHPEFNFQKGRQGKYLENAIKDNDTQLGKAFAKLMEAVTK